MPIYEYKCPVCGHELEVLAKFDAPDPVCPQGCNSSGTNDPPQAVTLVKKVSRTSFELKGGGWYSDGYSK